MKLILVIIVKLVMMCLIQILDLTLLIASYINARVQRPSQDTSPDI